MYWHSFRTANSTSLTGRTTPQDASLFVVYCLWLLTLRRMSHAAHLASKQLGLTAASFLDFLVREGTKQVHAANTHSPLTKATHE